MVYTLLRQKQASYRAPKVHATDIMSTTNWYHIFHLVGHLSHLDIGGLFFVVDTNKSPRGKGEGEIQLKARQWKTAEAYLALIS